MARLFSTFLVILGAAGDPARAAEWPRELSLASGGFWRQRIEVSVRNDSAREARGEPVSLAIGKGEGEIDLEGWPAEAVRVCDGKGREFLFSVQGPAGESIARGPIPARSLLAIPAECPPGKLASSFVYFDNPLAWPVPDFLPARTGIQNGGLEEGAGGAPSGWSHDLPDATHRAFLVTESPRSGSRCLKTVVAEGAEPTWISTRQAGIGISGGAKYVLEAWVRAEGVKGIAGWYIHVGNQDKPMIIAPMLDGGDGTYAWKKVSAEFTAPEEASTADLGTVLRGTGTAWFDDATLRRVSRPSLSASARAPERLDARETGAGAPWREEGRGRGSPGDFRLPIRIANFSGANLEGLASVDLSTLAARRRGRLEAAGLEALDRSIRRPSHAFGERLLFEVDLPARTIKTCYIYPSPGPSAPDREAAESRGYAGLLESKLNLVKNPSFEAGEGLPAGWSGGAAPERPAGASMGFAEPGLFGKRCAKIEIPRGTKPVWTGWRQDVPIQPGRTYLFAAWLKCKEIEGGSVQIHVHFLDSAGKLTKSRSMGGAGIPLSGTKDWTLMEGLFESPEDAAVFQIHFTMLATGTLRHDGALLAEVISAAAGKPETREEEVSGLSAWPVNPIVKVFQEDLPPPAVPPAAISAARGEKEPLQIAIRSAEAIEALRVRVDPPVHTSGARLDDVEVGVVGYVPIDHASNYYETDVPAWVRKVPSGPGRSDGWPGLWPDPILPRTAFDLPARSTRPVWFTLAIPQEAPAGEYSSKVKLESRGKTLKEIPFTVKVWDFALPRENHLRAIYDLRLGGRWNLPGKSDDEVRRQFFRFMAERRVSPDTVQPDPVFRYRDGVVSADFKEFDRGASYCFQELKLPHTYTPWCFYLFGWGHPPDEKFGEAPYEGKYPYKDVDRGKLRPAFKKAYQACLKAYWDHMKEKSWEKRCILYISDEPYYSLPHIREQMKALCDMVHEVDRGIPIYSSTWQYVPEWKGSLDVWGIGHHGTVPPDLMEKILKDGDRIWFTTDGQMCTDTPYCGVERLLPHYCFKYGAEAYEFWGISWLTYDPYEFGWHSFIHQSGEPGSSTWVRYPNGDGYLAYPGGPVGHDGPVTSIRLEEARDGVEDYEYLHLLRDLLRRAKAAGKSAADGEKALALASRLIEIPNAGGLSSTKILPDPDEVLEVREALARAIEALSRE